ncbi:hypothetical protein FSP39_007079 [Pinctada imbricata]|uniref:RING-type domain-containing protein n=1 Tax=Pinctada imbricata TaxID=66713 RepID=A0AA88XKL9_PINIB|nr:hypothetical protein FSP39_007079 [Pinctada imbricata]
MESKCSICCDIFDTPRFLNCVHTFCESCLQEYMNKNSKNGQIECPLCRAKTSDLKHGAKCFFENFFVKQRRNNKEIGRCEECAVVQVVKSCSHCEQYLCENCLASHKMVEQMKNNAHDSFEDIPNIPAALPPPPFNTGFLVSQKHFFQVSHEEISRRSHGQVCIKSIITTSEDECIVCPNGENVLITYNYRHGLELDRRYLEAEVVEMVMGINGYPLIIGNHTSVIFECRMDGVHPIANTGRYIPFTLATLNNDRFVVLSVSRIDDQIHGTGTSNRVPYGVLQIFGMRGEIYVEVSEVNGEHKLAQPRDVTVNLRTNEIYVADHTNRSLQLYKEDGAFETSFDGTEYTLQNNDVEVFVNCLVFPFTCCFDITNQILLASDTLGKIRVFSPLLDLLADGLESLFDNYFVELREHDVIEFVPCGICEKSTEATNTCRHCLQIVCFQCKPSHRLAVELSGETFPEENNIDDNDEEEEWGEAEEVNDQASLPFHLMMSQAIKCQYNVILDFAFHVPYHSHLLASTETNITCLVPKDRDFVAVLSNCGPNILLLNRLGDTVDRIRLLESMTCFAITKEDNILLTNGSNRLIMRCTEEGCSKFANTGHFSPLSISLFFDGRFAVTGVSDLEGKLTKRRDLGTFGVLQIFSRIGTLVKDVVRGTGGELI